MRLLLIVLVLVLVGCKPDPIEACVEAEKKRERLNMCRDRDTGKDACGESWQIFETLSEPRWREKCMRQAAGKD